MPILINKSSGLAEDLQDPSQAIQQGTHEVPLNDPEGNPVSAPYTEAAGLLGQGYSQPHPEQLQSLLDHAKFSSTPEQVKTFLEGAAKASTFGVSSGIEKALGVNPEDIRSREETNPGSNALGEVAGLGASALLPGAGALGVLGKAGAAAAEATGLGLKGAGVASRLGAHAVKQAVEMSILQGGDQVSKALLQDPDQTMQSAIANIGMAGVIGGGLGAGVGAGAELWKATKGSELGQFLGLLRDKAQGVADTSIQDTAASNLGIPLAPEVRAATSGSNKALKLASELQEGGTSSGQAIRDSFENFKTDARDNLVHSLGRTPEDLPALKDMSSYEEGKGLAQTLSKELSEKIDPISKQFEELKDRYKNIPLTASKEEAISYPGTPIVSKGSVGEDVFTPTSGKTVSTFPSSVDSIAEKIGQLAQKEGWATSPSSDIMQNVSRIMKELPLQKTLTNLSDYSKVIGNQMQGDIFNKPLARAGALIKNIFREEESNVVMSHLGQEAPELVGKYQAARQAFKANADLVDSLNDRLGIKSSVSNYPKALAEMGLTDGEGVLRRLSGKNDAELLDFLRGSFPETSQKLADYTKNAALAKSLDNEGMLHVGKLSKTLEKMSPELRQSAFSQEDLSKIAQTKEALDSLPKRINPSGTARTIDTLYKGLPGGIGAMLTMLEGKSIGVGYVLGNITRLLGREIPDAAKLSLLRVMGTEGPINGVAFKTMANVVNSVYKASKLADKALSGIFEGAGSSLTDQLLPSPSETAKVEKFLKAAQSDPNKLIDVDKDNQLAHYMPDHATASSATLTRASNYLNSVTPVTSNPGPLDPPRQPNDVEKAKYDKALVLITRPLSILKDVKEGTITPDDLQALNAVYPALYNGLKAKMLESIVSAKASERVLPYKTVLGASAFLGMPLEASIMPQNLSAGITQATPSVDPQQSNLGHSRGVKSGFKELSKLPNNSLTTQQAREQARISRK